MAIEPRVGGMNKRQVSFSESRGAMRAECELLSVFELLSGAGTEPQYNCCELGHEYRHNDGGWVPNTTYTV